MENKRSNKANPPLLIRAFEPDSALMRGLNGLSDIIILNLLCVLCSIPVFTAGASVTACYDYSFRILKGSDSGVIRGFFQAFRSNFRQVTPIWISLLLTGGLIYADWIIAGQMVGTVRTLQRTIAVIGAIILITELIYVFPLSAYFQNTRRAMVKNAILIAVANLPKTLALYAISILLPVLIIAFPQFVGWALFLLLIVWIEGVIMVNTAVMRGIFPRYAPPDHDVE